MSAGPIVVVDDSLTVRMDLDEALSAAGHATRLCATASEARRLFAAIRPALVLLDVMLPDGDGLELMSELRQEPETASVPIVMLSSEAEVRDRVRGLQRGADEYVGKPYEPSYLVARVEALLARSDAAVARFSVLVVDDSLTYREELAEALREAGYDVSVATSGTEGLRRAIELRPNAIIVDGVMEDLAGHEVIREVRLDPSLQRTPCLLLTASEGAASEVSALDAGADAYAHKGDGVAMVLARLGALLRAARDSRELGAPEQPARPARILLCDDSPSYLAEVADRLRCSGYEVIATGSGEEALGRLEDEEVDAIVLDLVMPGIDGIETCRRIKQRPERRGVPLILHSSNDVAAELARGLDAGADDFVPKTSELDVLEARIRAQLRRRRFEDENRRVRDELLTKDAETRAARELAALESAHSERLQQKNDELEALNRELGMFAHSVSHDLRQPLRAIDGFSRVLLERYAGELDDKGRHYLERVQAGTERMDELIAGLLVLSQASRAELSPRQVDLAEIARRVILRLRDANPERDVDIVTPASIPAVADPVLIESVLENLLGNAWKFSGERDDARIEIGVERSADQTAYFVRDNGAGFDMDSAENLFGPFQRLHEAARFAGTGVGLATVQRIIHRHRGRLWAESSPGAGATFFFSLGPFENVEMP